MFYVTKKLWLASPATHLLLFIFTGVLIGFSPLAVAGQESNKHNILTLAHAITLALEHNPQLQQYAVRTQVFNGERQTAQQAPRTFVTVEFENTEIEKPDSGKHAGSDAAEITLALSSVIEMGNKRNARVDLVDSQALMLRHQKQVDTVTVLGQLTQLYIQTLATQNKILLGNSAIQLAQEMHAVISHRVKLGASPEAEVYRAKVLIAQANAQLARLQVTKRTQLVEMATFWGATTTPFDKLDGDLFKFVQAQPLEELFKQAKNSPEFSLIASDLRIKNAELQLARSQSQSDIGWQIGIRQLAQSDESGVVASVSVPLFSARRNRGNITAAIAERDTVTYQHSRASLQMYQQLYRAYHLRQQNISLATTIQSEIIPALTQALKLTKDAYESGRYRYADWLAAQTELLTAKHQLIDAATSAQINQAIIEQLIAQPLTNLN